MPPDEPATLSPPLRYSIGSAKRAGLRHIRYGMGCEDSIASSLTDDGHLHVAVADGVSGGAKGEVASAAVVAFAMTVQVAYPPAQAVQSKLSEDSADDIGNEQTAQLAQAQQTMAEQLQAMDGVVQQALAQQAPGRSGAATFAGAWLNPQGLGWVNRVGDCRIYLWRVVNTEINPEGTVVLERAFADQNYTELQLEPPPGIPHNNPAHMVGNNHMGQPELRAVQLLPGDGLLLCSDGLHDVLEPAFMARCLQRGLRRRHSCTTLANNLLRQALAHGSDDDIAVLVLRFSA